MAKKSTSISVFFPCYNDAKTIGGLVKDAFDTLAKIAKDHEVIVVNDGSRDESGEVLLKLAKKHKKLKVVTHKKNRGYGGALKSGFANASKDLVFYTDGDGQYDVNEMPILLSLMTPDVSFINGIKMRRGDVPHRIFFGNMHRFINRWLFWLPIYDVDCDFRLIRRDIIKKIKLQSNSGSICIELAKKAERAGAVFRQVSVHHYDRKYGQSQFFRPSKIIKTYLDIGALWLKLMIFDNSSR
ncbi:MAG: glycosyltransferase family 2 protein [Candidatus Blackburnbacteria bacterium]|nr:glycosyltransferase family 2 protein [Candidatus Blackburnbacteria bacterium]